MLDVFVLSGVCLYREGLSRLLVDEPDLRIVGSAANATAGLEDIRASGARLVLLDLATEGALGDARLLAQSLPRLLIVALGACDERQRVVEYAESGITAYVCRD